MGRAPKIVELQTRKIGKQEKLNRKRQQEELKGDRDALQEIPAWLDETAAAEYQRVIDEAAKIPIFDNLDRTVLAVYAAAYSQFVEATQHLTDEGATVMTRLGGSAASPWVTVADKAASTIMKCSTRLGLSTVDRLKLIVPTKEKAEPNKFLSLIKKA